MTKYTNPYAQKAYEIIMPLMGDLMTQNVLKIQSKKIGKEAESLRREDMSILAESMKTGLAIFLGSEAAKTIAMKIAQIS